MRSEINTLEVKKILNIFYWENIWWIERNIEFLSIIFNDLNFKNYFLKFSNKKNNLKLNWSIKSLNENIKRNIFIKILRPIKRAYNIKQYCNKNIIDISISHWDSVNISNILSKVLFWNNSKIIVTINNSLDQYKNNIIWKIMILLLKLLYKKADKIICISKEMEGEIVDYLTIKKKKITTIYNPINLEEIENIKEDNLWEHRKLFKNWKKTFLHIARLDKIKNQKFLIKAFSKYNKNNNSQLIIIWDWEEKNNIINLIKRLKVESYIHIIWYKENIYDYIKNSDYFIFSSISEWFWRSLIEANSCWLPILTYDFKYWAKEIIRNNNNLSKCTNIEIHENWILTPYMNMNKYIEWLNILEKNNFTKETIIKNANKFNIKELEKQWSKILKKI